MLSASKAPKPPFFDCKTSGPFRCPLDIVEVFLISSPEHGVGGEGGIIQVRIMIVFELKRPATRFQVRSVDAPVAGSIQQLFLVFNQSKPLVLAVAVLVVSCKAHTASSVSQTGDTQG